MDVCSVAGSTNTTCAACCSDCRLYITSGSNGIVSFSQDDFPNYPTCCAAATQPLNTCTSSLGVDPKNNVMSYVSMDK